MITENSTQLFLPRRQASSVLWPCAARPRARWGARAPSPRPRAAGGRAAALVGRRRRPRARGAAHALARLQLVKAPDPGHDERRVAALGEEPGVEPASGAPRSAGMQPLRQCQVEPHTACAERRRSGPHRRAWHPPWQVVHDQRLPPSLRVRPSASVSTIKHQLVHERAVLCRGS